LVKVRIFNDIDTVMNLFCKAKILYMEKVWISCS
jgi:hypothetical protein